MKTAFSLQTPTEQNEVNPHEVILLVYMQVLLDHSDDERKKVSTEKAAWQFHC